MRAFRLLLLAGVLGSLLFSPTAARADYLNGFDTYTGGANPGPFTFTPDAAACWSFGVSTPQGFTLLSQPNLYQVLYLPGGAGCSGFAHTAAFVLNTNSTQTAVGWRFAVSAAYGTLGTGTYFYTGTCAAPSTFNKVVVNTLPNRGAPTPWTEEGPLYSGPQTAGRSCQLTISFKVDIADSAQLVALYFDNMYVSGAAAVLPVYDFAMYNLLTGKLYNVTAYDLPQPRNQTSLGLATAPTSGLTLTTQYPALYNLASNIVVAPLEPTLNLPLANANLVEVCVTALYCNSFIPSASGTTKAWLVAPSQALSCLFQVANAANQFPPGSTITLQQGFNTVASGYLDVNHQFTAFLPTGSYALAVTFGTFSFTTTVSVSATATTFTIPIAGLTGNAFVGGLGTISYNAGWDAPLANVVYYYADSSLSTTYVKVQLLKSNASGTFPIQTAAFSPGPYGTVQGSFSCATNACNATLSASLSVMFTATNQFGSLQPYGPVGLTAGGLLPGISGTPPPPSLGGMSEFFPGLSYQGLGGFFALLVGASAFGEYDAPFGAIFLGALGVVLVGLGVLPWPTLVTASIVVVAVLSFIEWREKRSANPYT